MFPVVCWFKTLFYCCMCLFLGYKEGFSWNSSYCGRPYDITQPKLSYHAGKKERETILVWFSFFWMKMDKIMVKIQSEYMYTLCITQIKINQNQWSMNTITKKEHSISNAIFIYNNATESNQFVHMFTLFQWSNPQWYQSWWRWFAILFFLNKWDIHSDYVTNVFHNYG